MFVDNGSCSPGKVLKVTVVARGLHRKKVCVSALEARASAKLGACAFVRREEIRPSSIHALITVEQILSV